jgi:hypothetical protein
MSLREMERGMMCFRGWGVWGIRLLRVYMVITLNWRFVGRTTWTSRKMGRRRGREETGLWGGGWGRRDMDRVRVVEQQDTRDEWVCTKHAPTSAPPLLGAMAAKAAQVVVQAEMKGVEIPDAERCGNAMKMLWLVEYVLDASPPSSDDIIADTVAE